MNTKLLKALYMVPSPSGDEKKMRKTIKRWINKNVADATVTTDAAGNLYAQRGQSGTYPCCVAHLDEVHHRRNGLIITEGGGIIAGRNPSNYQPEGIGADDKNGIYVALMLLKEFNVAKVAFFVGEEVGCVGSEQADMSFFDDVRFVLQCDRRGASDFVTSIGGTELCSSEWVEAIGLNTYHYAPHDGCLSDVATLKQRGLEVCCANMSCGYYNPHTAEEVTVVRELENTHELCRHIFATMTDVYPHQYVPYKPPVVELPFKKYQRIHNELDIMATFMEREIASCEDFTEFDLNEFYMMAIPHWPSLQWSDYTTIYEELMGEPWDEPISEEDKYNF